MRVFLTCLALTLLLAGCATCQKGATRCTGVMVEACNGATWEVVQDCTTVKNDKFAEFLCKATVDEDTKATIHACIPKGVTPETVPEPPKPTPKEGK